MIFQLLFILIWVAIVTLAKDRIKKKIKQFLKPQNIDYEPSPIYENIQSEYNNLKTTLSLNIISIKDELASRIISKKKKQKKKNPIKEDIIETLDEDEEPINMYETFSKAMDILKKLFYDIFNKITSYFKKLI